MKFNKWTVGLAAAGVVSLASAAQAEEQTANTVLTALSSTTLSGYVDTSAQWNLGTGNRNNPPYKFGGDSKADGFNLNVVQVSIAKPLDESPWAAGYHVDLWFGPDANTLGTASPNSFFTSGDFAIRQAYVALRTPIGNGIDWKIGVFDSIIGYESVASPQDPNYTRSYGHSIEPQTHTGILGSYRINDNVSIAAGIANTVGPSINSRAFGTTFDSDTDLGGKKAESYKTYMGSIALTAPDNWDFLSGSTLYAGVVNGYNDNENGTDYGENSTSWYVGSTLATPVTGLRVGAAFDYLDIHRWSHDTDGAPNDGNVWALALYSSYQATEKLSLHLRGEYLDDQAFFFNLANGGDGFSGPFRGDEGEAFKVYAVTATVQYDLWKNVLSRLEFRWDHSDSGKVFGNNPNTSSFAPTRKNAYMLAANIIYKF